jgi:hypothetical protein
LTNLDSDKSFDSNVLGDNANHPASIKDSEGDFQI